MHVALLLIFTLLAARSRRVCDAAVALNPARGDGAVGRRWRGRGRPQVLGRFEGGLDWYEARVAAVGEGRTGGTVDLQYDDGDFEASVPKSLVRVFCF